MQEGNYIDSNSIQITVKALHDYTATRDDELSFCKHAIITNVVKPFPNWWQGDYGGRKQGWFPANFVTELSSQENGDDTVMLMSTLSKYADEFICVSSSRSQSAEARPLGIMQKGSLDILNCTVMEQPPARGKEWVFRFISPSQPNPIDVATNTEEEMREWIKKIRETAQSASELVRAPHLFVARCSFVVFQFAFHPHKVEQGKKIERELKIAKELSSLIVYCCAVDFRKDGKTDTSVSIRISLNRRRPRLAQFQRNVLVSGIKD